MTVLRTILLTGATVLLLAACSNPPTEVQDTQAPVPYVTSSTLSDTASYLLTGVSVDDTGTTAVTVSPSGGTPVAASLSGNEFSASLTLQSGVNNLTISATDAAGNTGTTDHEVLFEAAPGSLSLSSDIALPGEELTISGSDFGNSGSVDIAGLPAVITDWTDSSITLTVPADTGMGPQTLTVNAPYGSTSADLFIGFDFPTGDMAELAALALPQGTAVRLAAGNYSGGPAGTVVLDSLSLYGQGPDQTTIAFGDAVALDFIAAPGSVLEITDLSLSIDTAVFSTGEVPLPTAAEAGLSPQAFEPGSLTFRNIHWTDASATLTAVSSVDAVRGPYRGDIRIIDSDITAAATEFYFEVHGSLEILGTSIDAEDFDARLHLGELKVHYSQVVGAASLLFEAVMGLDFETALVQSTGSYVDLRHSNPLTDGGHRLYPGSSTVLRNSEIISDISNMEWSFGPDSTVLFANTHVQTDDYMDIAFGEGTLVTLTGSTFTSTDDAVNLLFEAGSIAELTGNQLIARWNARIRAEAAAEVTLTGENTLSAGYQIRFTSDGGTINASGNSFEAASVNPDTIFFSSQSASSRFSFMGNTFTLLGSGGLHLAGGGDFVLQNNVITGYSGSGTALRLEQAAADPEATVTFTGNQLSSFQNALNIVLGGVGANHYDAAINDNNFGFEMTAAPQVARVENADNASLDARNNVWNDFTELAQVTTLIQHFTSTVTLEVDPIAQP